MTANAPDPLEVPDFAEPFEAWRIWRVVAEKDGYILGSVIKPTLWQPCEPLIAECLRHSALRTVFRRGRATSHSVPDDPCECGIYAGWLPEVRRYLIDPPAHAAVARVLGQVSLWGRVIECERGFRASHAYPLRLYVPVDAAVRSGHRWEDLVSGLERYRVPVEPLPARCSEAVGVLEQRQLESLHGADR